MITYTWQFLVGKNMKIGIVGCGAMGSVYASFFSNFGFDVSVTDKWKAHMDKIASSG